MTALSVSVVIVSRHRPEELRKCVMALQFQTFRSFELIVVTDTATAKGLSELIPKDRIKTAICAEANISKARNLGIERAAGDIVAFVDDDAIAEPTWLERLVAPFEDSNIAATGGFVRGRNGISYQWQAEQIDSGGVSHPVTHGAACDVNRATKTQGTNCAFRRDALIELGGFDENFHFYLDESDLNLRVARSGRQTKIVPEAEVQHGFARSSFRGTDRRPAALFEIGASQAYFVAKHAGAPGSIEVFQKHQWHRLEKALVEGMLEPRDVKRLWSELLGGIAAGEMRKPPEGRDWSAPSTFKRFARERAQGPHRYLTGRWIARRQVFARAAELSRSGVACTAIILSPTAIYHRRWFHSEGFWVQMGGIFGKSSRSDSLLAWYTRENRIRRERASLANTR